jgi:hypothetical protein
MKELDMTKLEMTAEVDAMRELSSVELDAVAGGYGSQNGIGNRSFNVASFAGIEVERAGFTANGGIASQNGIFVSSVRS